MKEGTFIRRNKEEWDKFDDYLKGDRVLAPRQAVQSYLKITSDLSHAQTFYPNSEVTSYLNDLAHKAHRDIYKFRRFDSQELKNFVLKVVPNAFYECRRSILWSFLIFTTFIFVGFLSSIYDDTYVRLIMGDAYVNLTKANIEKGDPLGIYGNMQSLPMFSYIGLNNIIVSFRVFALGIFAGMGTIYGLMQNGVMVGAFLHMFYAENLFLLAFTTIMIHGTLELFAIIAAGGGGLELGKAMLFPGTYPRLYALRKAAVRSVYLILGLVPIFIIAAILEGFLTRHYLELGLFVRILVIILSVVLIYWMFFRYPKKLIDGKK
jgi:uncharacterized membrane protein SpoIIM required for sporulation